jgi:hypothetical protein
VIVVTLVPVLYPYEGPERERIMNKLLLIALSGFAMQGATITWQNSYQTVWGVGLPIADPGSMSIIVPNFDMSLGTLTDFTVRVSATADMGLFVYTRLLGGVHDVTATLKFVFKDGQSPQEGLAFLVAEPIHFPADTPGLAEYVFPSVITGTVNLGLSCGNNHFCIDERSRDGGTNRYSLRPQVLAFVAPLGPAQTFGTITANAIATYTYTPIVENPEPASWALIATGLGALAYYRRRTAV